MRRLCFALAALASVALSTACKVDSRLDYLGDKDPKHFGLGQPATAAQIAAVDVDASPSGIGLPAGSGTPEQGAPLFAANCAACHGRDGEGQGQYPRLLGGPKGTFDFARDPKLVMSIGNYWPYATTLYDYIHRAMPFNAPGSLDPNQTYAVVAFLLSKEGIIPAGTVLDAKALTAIQMPAKSHFVMDDRTGSTGGKNVR